ncbi:unnamed protein product [Jaminaea pallidilutea]
MSSLYSSGTSSSSSSSSRQSPRASTSIETDPSSSLPQPPQYLDELDTRNNFSSSGDNLDLLGPLQERAWRRQVGLRGDDEQLTWEELRRRSRRRRTSNRRAEDDVESDEDDDNGDRDGQNSDGDSSDGQDASDSESLFSQTTSQYLAEQERHLQEAMDQLELALKVILCPLLGKWLGRKWAYWAFDRYHHHGGLSLRFFGLSWVPETRIPDWLAVLLLPMGGG